MSVKEIKALERRWFREANKGKAAGMAVINELHATDYVFHSGNGKDIRGLKDYKQYMSEFYKAVPDLHVTLNDMVVEGDKIAIRWTMTGTHKGKIEGIPPTNKKITLWGISIERVVGGKFVESWERADTLGLMQQLGVIPIPKK